MKAAGALLVILSCSVFGFAMAQQLKRRSELLRSLTQSLLLLRSGVCLELLPIREVLVELSERENADAVFWARCMHLFEDGDLRAAWNVAAMECTELGLKNEECGVLAELGTVIGRCEAEKQQELIERTAAYFDRRAQLAQEERQNRYKLRAALGVGSGLVFAILML